MSSTLHDVVVVGAGPAGLAAAARCARAGLNTLMIDENAGPGGQVYRAIGRSPLESPGVLGTDYWSGEARVAEFEQSGAKSASATTVWSLDRTLELGTLHQGQARMIQARQVILATGALERPFPIPGWTLPGVMSAGGVQTLLKSSGALPDGPVILAGCGPLLWLLAAQILRAGGAIECMLDTTPRGAIWRELRHLPAFIGSPLFAKGLSLMREVRSRVPIIKGVTTLEARGTDRLETVRWQASGETMERRIEHLILHQGVVPNVNLAMAAGVEHQWDDTQLCFRPVLDAFGRSSVPGISVAGDGAGIAGAWAAEARGGLAAIAALRNLTEHAHHPEASDAEATRLRATLARHQAGRSFIDRIYQPNLAFRVPSDDTLVCRCEEVSAGQVRDSVRLGCEGPNQMKAFLRCGMGPCQGRLCGLTVTETIAQARGVSPGEVGYYRLRPPVKPIPLSALAEMPVDDEAVRAVVRG